MEIMYQSLHVFKNSLLSLVAITTECITKSEPSMEWFMMLEAL